MHIIGGCACVAQRYVYSCTQHIQSTTIISAPTLHVSNTTASHVHVLCWGGTHFHVCVVETFELHKAIGILDI